MINSFLLRGKIYTEYRHMSEYAEKINWSKQRLHNIISGKQIPNVKDIKIMQESLKLSQSEIMEIFLPDQSQAM